MKLTVFSTTTCPYCLMLKNYLKEKNITFSEKLVDQDDLAREEMLVDSGGFMGVPFTLVVKDDGTKDTVVGFDKGKFEKILQIQK